MKIHHPLSSAVCATLLLTAAQLHANAPPGRYKVDGAVVTDAQTKLIWQRTAAPGLMYWQEAKDFCAGLKLVGQVWRMPKYKELMTLVDFMRSNPAIDIEAFPNAPADAFWADSLFVEDGKPYWVDFKTGAGHNDDPKMLGGERMLRVRCVR
ncbi:MAG TPA: DUF1566 domain-containing protein [Polyangiales bacterium]|nr:DUF1566 domain-containing protein [Polyangiales bacterium]